MNEDVHDLIHGYFDGLINADQEAALSRWVKESPEHAAVFAAAARLHDRLHDVIRARNGSRHEARAPACIRRSVQESRVRRSWSRGLLLGGAVALVALGFITWWTVPAPVSAAMELDRLIETASQAGDCSYLVRSRDSEPEPTEERRPPLHHATLYIRRPDKYVLVRRFPDGRPFVTGCDGERSWSIPPEGAIRVSSDPLRFRGPVPGHQHGIPFVNLRSDLVQLRDAYTVALLEPGANGLCGLLAQKKSQAFRGPRRVELWYDAQTGVIQRMVFDGMPQARGGPNSLTVELLKQGDLGTSFFEHEAHHDPKRRVIDED